MTWTYRVMRTEHVLDKGYSYGIYEVYKGLGKKGPGWTEHAIAPRGETLAELRRDYGYMAEAFDLPVLDHETGKPIKGGKP